MMYIVFLHCFFNHGKEKEIEELAGGTAGDKRASFAANRD